MISIDEIVFDFDGTEGQARPDLVRSKVEAMRLNPVTETVVAKVWERAAGGPFLALSGQHTTYALKTLRDEAMQRREAIPSCLTSVRCTVYSHRTPLPIRMLISGSDQNRQAHIARVLLSRVFEICLQQLHDDPRMSLSDAVKLSIHKSGAPRPATVKELGEWMGPAHWLQTCGPVAIQAVKHLESHGLAGSIATLRSLRGLVTPKARMLATTHILSGVRTQQQFESVVRDARHDQLVDVHWRAGNPAMDQEKVTDLNLRAAFSAAASDAALRINWGSWTWRADRPFPDWGMVLEAPLYKDEQYSGLRQSLLGRKFRAVAAPAGSADVLNVRVQRGMGDPHSTVRVYCPRTTRSVPGSVEDLPVRLAIHRCRPLGRAPEHVMAAVAGGGAAVLWGTAAELRAPTEQMNDVGNVESVDVAYFIRQRVVGSKLPCLNLVLRVITLAGAHWPPVCPHLALTISPFRPRQCDHCFGARHCGQGVLRWG
jgi:hypothetical protein